LKNNQARARVSYRETVGTDNALTSRIYAFHRLRETPRTRFSLTSVIINTSRGIPETSRRISS
jgi:hypothetical protein